MLPDYLDRDYRVSGKFIDRQPIDCGRVSDTNSRPIPRGSGSVVTS
ncbi:hypothetical protein V0288_02560 [Pannus brasiliensis CCIBt3594]|uniref:Uncharacterized protein n=1 Tax=Pannus brasiliensis CCIBt3594 TaxID=1427578 RepID=A0AAW9QTV6_9CHRO